MINAKHDLLPASRKQGERTTFILMIISCSKSVTTIKLLTQKRKRACNFFANCREELKKKYKPI